MNDAAPLPSPIDRLRARAIRQAADPRVGLIPEARATLHELIALLDQIDELAWRVSAIERGMTSLLPRPDEFE